MTESPQDGSRRGNVFICDFICDPEVSVLHYSHKFNYRSVCAVCVHLVQMPWVLTKQMLADVNSVCEVCVRAQTLNDLRTHQGLFIFVFPPVSSFCPLVFGYQSTSRIHICTCSAWIFVYGSISLFLEVEFTIWCCSSAVTFGWCLLIKLFLVRISCFCQDKADRDVSQCLIKKKNRFCCYKHSKKSSNKRIQGRNSDKCSDPLALKTFS